ncbi:MAG TPA: hypothetical protein VEP89_14375 [Draconibacterium sp.]|nr:hypothetical protein [Draconibacterium sp.]
MINFTKALYTDLLAKIQKMVHKIESGKHHDDIKGDFVNDTIESLKILEHKITGIIVSGDLEIDFLLANNLSNYSDLNQNLEYIELFRLQPIKNYGSGDHYFKVLVEKIYDDSNILSTPPLVSTISNSDNYYWAVPFENIIAIPFWEEESLINVPDIYHEIGHLIFVQYRSILAGKFIPVLNDYFKLELSYAVDERRINDFEILEATLEYWKASWFEEFVCDLIATFLTGSAFAWTNMKLTTISHSKAQVYHYQPSHPADEARTQAIIKMLKIMENDEESEEIFNSWKSFEELINYPKRPCYDIIFSNDILDKLTMIVYDFCNDIDINIYIENTGDAPKTIAQYLNDIWYVSRHKSEDFAELEKFTIGQIKEQLKIED